MPTLSATQCLEERCGFRLVRRVGGAAVIDGEPHDDPSRSSSHRTSDASASCSRMAGMALGSDRRACPITAPTPLRRECP